MKTKPEVTHTPTPKEILGRLAFNQTTKADAAFIVRACNAYEKDQEIKKELLRKLNDAQRIIVELTSEAKDHKKPNGKYCDECTAQIWPCPIIRGHYEAKAIEEAIAKAEGK